MDNPSMLMYSPAKNMINRLMEADLLWKYNKWLNNSCMLAGDHKLTLMKAEKNYWSLKTDLMRRRKTKWMLPCYED